MTEDDKRAQEAGDDADDMPDLEEEAGAGEDEGDDMGAEGKLNRQEKKARKALSKLGMKLVPGIKRVTVKKQRTTLFVIANPDVYKSSSSETFVIFGEAKVDDAPIAPSPAAQLASMGGGNMGGMGDYMRQAAGGSAKPSAAPAAAADEDTGDDDATGLDEKDINLVVEQTGVTKSRAIAALKKHDKDIVNAIMELTNG